MNSRKPVAAVASSVTLIFAAGLAGASPYAPPAGYYDTATSTVPATLKSQLHNIIDGHIERTYDDARVALQILDASATDPTKMVMIYDGQLFEKQWDNGVTWNREHTWPRSRGIDTTGPDNADLHMLRPSESALNSVRSNKPFGTLSSSYFDPGAYSVPQDRGEIARTQFYADTRYDGGEAATTDLTLVSGFPSGSQMGHLTELLEWHFAYPPDERELRRNHVVWSSDIEDWTDPEVTPFPFTLHQGNRNPFVDRPELVWTIWGSGPNNATIYVDTPEADGSSALEFDLGTFILGAPGAVTPVTIQKAGSHPAAFTVSVSGDASCPQAGTPLSVAYTPAPAGVTNPVIEVSLDSGSPGIVSGEVIVHNAQLTSAGMGQGSDDADDVISLAGTALESANASFAGADVDQMTIDLGTVYRYGYEPSTSFIIKNLTGAFRADLDLDSITPSGASAVCTTDLAPFSGLAPGSSLSFTATVASEFAPTTYNAVYTLSFSDEDIPGEVTGQTLVLTVTATVVPPDCIGDLDGDNDVDVFDFTEISANFGVGPNATRNQGDYNGDGVVDVLDFGVFAGDFGCGF